MNPLNRTLIFVCCAIFIFGYLDVSFGSEWRFYYQTEVEKENRAITEKLYYDATSVVKPQKDIVRVTQKVTTSESEEKAEIDSKMRLIEINCSSNKYRYVSVTEYELDTGKVLSEQRTDNAPWVRFSLNSSIAGLYDNVCFEKKQPMQVEKKTDKQPNKEAEKEKDKKSEGGFFGWVKGLF